jgi:hypothetical protein
VNRPPSFTRIYADADGVTHLEDVVIGLQTRGVPESDLIAAFSAPYAAESVQFRDIVREADPGAPHNAPRRMFLVSLGGHYEIEASDGATRQIGPGGVLLLEDVDGDGHVTRRIGDEPRRTMIIPLA